MKVLLAAALAASAFTFAPAAHAEVSAACLAHLAAVPAGQKTTAAGDVRYHRLRGEASVCTEREAEEIDGSRSYSSSDDSRDNNRYDDGKSRYCKKRWFC